MSHRSDSNVSMGLRRLEQPAVVLDIDARTMLESGRVRLDLSTWYRPAAGGKQFSADAVWFGCRDP